jgi:hypothetical protein
VTFVNSSERVGGNDMRKLWAAGAATVMCLALDGLPALAQEASGGDAQISS